MEKTEKDEFLIDKIRNGDRKSEEELYNKYRKIVTKHIVTKFPFNYDTDDDVSEILIKIFESISDYDKEKSKFLTWVMKITNHHMIDKSRSSTYSVINNTSLLESDDRGMITTNTSDMGVCGVGCFYSTTSLSDSIETNDSLDFIENKIGVKDFHLLNMKYGEGFNYNEMAEEMRTSSSTISNRVNYVKSKLKKGK